MRYFFSALGMVSLFFSGCSKSEPPKIPHESPVSKTVMLAVYAANDYSDAFYNNSMAELQLTSAKMSGDNPSAQVLWDTVYTWRKLADFPIFQNQAIIQKTFPILESKENLHVSIIRKYNFNGALSQSSNGIPVANHSNAMRLNVDL